MDAYTSFAQVYDLFMDNIPYREWCCYLTSLLREYGISDGLVLDLGCGTGNVTQILAKEGYEMIGVDNAEEMLSIAMEKKQETGLDILYLLQDMRSLELYGTVRAAVSICDSLNYLLEYSDLVQVLRLVNLYLDPGGIFIFDINTLYKYTEILGESTIAENREEGSFIWENSFDPESRLNEYMLTLFLPDGLERGEEPRYRRYQEIHIQRAFSLDEVRQAVLESGMELLACYDAFTREAPKSDSERIYFIAREKGKRK